MPVSSSRSVSWFARVAGGLLLAGGAFAVLGAQQPFAPPSASFATIVHQPAQQSSFTLDRSMLGVTDGFFAQDPEGKRIAAGLNSVTFHNFHYRDLASYDYGALSAVNAAYETAGFRHLVNANGRGGAATDLWLRFTGANVTDVVVLSRGDRNMNAIQVSCNLRPLDLLHLSGHFGIPKVDESAVMVPAGPGGSYPPPAPPNGTYANPANGTYSGAGANGSYNGAPPAAAAPIQNPPTLHQHSANDPQ